MPSVLGSRFSRTGHSERSEEPAFSRPQANSEPSASPTTTPAPSTTNPLRIAYLVHSLRSDWNNGNAHFLRGLLRALGACGHQVTIFEPAHDWSYDNLHTEPRGPAALAQFQAVYPDLDIRTYPPGAAEPYWREQLAGVDAVLLHEWNPPALAHTLLVLRPALGYRLLFHDTHHRASSSPEQIARFGLTRFDGILAFGEVLSRIYRERFHIRHVFTLHEAADTTVFHPRPSAGPTTEILWIGNWGDDERSAEIQELLLKPAAALRPARTTIYGVRYPQAALDALDQAGVHYGGYLPNLDAPAAYAAAQVTVHIPRRQYAEQMPGIPTIRVFEALACGIPLVSAPWQDAEQLFRPGDFLYADSGAAMRAALAALLADPALRAEQSARGLRTVLARHTCMHRARELTSILEELAP